MKINKIELQDYQSHKETTIILSPYVNVITGPTDSGKSAIWRALRKLFRDLPRGEKGRVRKGQKKCVITVHLDNGNVIKRGMEVSGGKTIKNFYKVNKEDEFINYGSTIPLEVRKAFEMADIDFHKIDIDLNFQNQYEPPFLLTEAPSARAKVLGKIIGTDVLDRASQQTKLEHNRTSNLLSTSKDNLKELEESMMQFSGLDEIAERLTKVEQKIDLLDDLKTKCDKLKQLQYDFEECNEKLTLLEALQNKFEAIVTIEESFKNAQKDSYLLSSIQDFLQKEEELNFLRERKTNLEKVEKIESGINLLSDLTIQIGSLKVVHSRYWNYQNALRGLENTLGEVLIDCDETLDEFNKMLKKMKKCPVCYNDLTKDAISRITGVKEEE